MPIVYNNKNIRDIYYGSTRIRQVYLGSKLIWERAQDLYGWGNNDYGQLGLGNTTPRTSPARAGTSSTWSSVSCGQYHNMAINTAKELYAWGNNEYGQLGLGGTTPHSSPTRVGTASNWVSVACGKLHTIAINTMGELYAWGNNGSGQLGLGDTNQRTSPTRVGTATNWASVAGGDSYTVAIKTSGELWAWGYNYYGQLGNGESGSGANRTIPTRAGTATNWASVACGYSHTLVINTAGELYSCGYNPYGQLGLGNSGAGTNQADLTRVGSAANWASVSCGQYHTLAINTAGELWAWGYNTLSGPLGLGDTINRTTPTRVGTATNWASVAGGSAHTLAINTAGELYTWGQNTYGQLGLGESGEGNYRNVPTRAGASTNWVSVAGGDKHSIGIGV